MSENKVKQSELLDQLEQATDHGKAFWTPTAVADQFTASFKGKLNLVVTGFTNNSGSMLQMFDDQSREMLRVYSSQNGRVQQLFEAVRRNALHVDEAIDELLQELKG